MGQIKVEVDQIMPLPAQANSKGTGTPNTKYRNNCLIISVLQHVTGDYCGDHVDQAMPYEQKLARSATQISFAHALIMQQTIGRILQNDTAAFHHITTRRHRQSLPYILLDQQDRHSF